MSVSFAFFPSPRTCRLMGVGAFVLLVFLLSVTSWILNWIQWNDCKVFVSYIWWQVPGVGNTGTQCKLSSYLFNMCIHMRSWVFGFGRQVCLSSQSPVLILKSCLEMLLADRRFGENKLPFLFCKDTLEGTSFEREKGEARYYRGVKERTETICLF